jgi:hypothetical protein
MRITDGSIIAYFAFDVGFEIALDRLGDVLAARPAEGLSGKKRTPAHLQYARPPLVLPLAAGSDLSMPDVEVRATIFDFGAVSISYRWSMTAGGPVVIEELPAHATRAAAARLETDARRRVEELMAEIGAFVSRAEILPLVEDYYLLVLERLDPQLTADELVERHAATLAQALRFESARLSRDHVTEVLAQRISYYEGDLVVVDWNAALIADPDYADAASVLELMNVELLEARTIDAKLDRRIARFELVTGQARPYPLPLRSPYTETLRDLAELRIDSAILSERVGNALKLIGDLYLARIHDAAAARFNLHEWERSIAGKLALIEDFYEVLADRARTAQNQALELIVIVLIFVELVVALVTAGR